MPYPVSETLTLDLHHTACYARTMLRVMESEATAPSYGVVTVPPGLQQCESRGQLVTGSGREPRQEMSNLGPSEPSPDYYDPDSGR